MKRRKNLSKTCPEALWNRMGPFVILQLLLSRNWIQINRRAHTHRGEKQTVYSISECYPKSRAIFNICRQPFFNANTFTFIGMSEENVCNCFEKTFIYLFIKRNFSPFLLRFIRRSHNSKEKNKRDKLHFDYNKSSHQRIEAIMIVAFTQPCEFYDL